MSAQSAVQAGRIAAESLMSLTVRAYRPTGGYTTDPVTTLEVLVFVDEGTTRGKLQGRGGFAGNDPKARTQNVGGVDRILETSTLHIPVSATAPEAGPPTVGWEYVIEAVGAHDDGTLLGRRYRVVNAPAKSAATARRLDVVEIPARP